MAITTDTHQQVYDLLSKTSNLSFINADQETGPRLGFTPGQRVTAEVLTTLPDKRVQVQVGTERFNLELPMAVRQGQMLELTYITEDPRSTFAIARQGGLTQPVSLSDASRLLGLLVGNEQIVDPKLRSSLQSISDMLRRSSGEAGVLANLMDEALTYGGSLREAVKGPPQASGDLMQQSREELGTALQQGWRGLNPGQARLAAFESSAAQILLNIARNSRFLLVEAANQPVVPLPLMPGEEVDAAVLGALPGGRTFVQVAGTSLELVLPRAVQAGEILRLTYISSQPRPLFALPRGSGEAVPSTLSEAGRWLSVLEHGEGGPSEQQMYVLERLNSVLKSLPPDSPAFTAIQDEAITYHTLLQGRSPAAQTLQSGFEAIVPQYQSGNGIVLNDDMAKLLQALINGNRLAILEALDQQTMPMGLAPGQQVKGEVIALLGGGRFLVQVAGQSLQFSMAKGAQRGDLINLFFITDEPTPTFLMARFGRPGDSRVSETGRWLSGFIGTATERMPAQETMGILRTLLAEPPAEASQVGKLLQQGLRESGLFYESHLARWFGGDYPLADILREPQGRLSHLNQAIVGQPAGTADDEAVRAGMKGASMEVMETMLKRAGSSLAHEGIADQRTLSVVREQLDALQSGQILFRGELFPGQQMEWSVKEREARRNAAGEKERTWDTTLSLDLPKLGSITARLVLEGTRVSMDFSSADADSAVLLDAARPALVEQLQSAGLNPGEIGIRYDAPGE